MSTTIRTDSREHAISDLSDARICGAPLPARVDLDDGSETLYPRCRDTGEVCGPQWQAESDSGRVYPL